MMNWAWIAGFYEGEGYIGKHKHVSTGTSSVIHLSITQAEKSILDHIRTFVGYGKVYPRRPRKKNEKFSWIYQLYGKEAVRFAKRILPFMNSKRKIRQLKKVI